MIEVVASMATTDRIDLMVTDLGLLRESVTHITAFLDRHVSSHAQLAARVNQRSVRNQVKLAFCVPTRLSRRPEQRSAGVCRSVQRSQPGRR